MKIKITSCSDDRLWYRYSVGDTLSVKHECDDHYETFKSEYGATLIVYKKDCVLVDDKISSETMRRVKFCKCGTFELLGNPNFVCYGRFHGFHQESMKNSIKIVAVVEDDEGLIHVVGVKQIKFID